MKLRKPRKEKKNDILGRMIDHEVRKRRIPYCAAVVAAAGTSERMQSLDKLFVELGGAPVLAYSLKALQESPSIKEIVIATREENLMPVAEMCNKYGITKATKIVLGGETRMESVLIGCCEVSRKTKLIAVHDGARPFVTTEIIEKTVSAASAYNAAAPGIVITDTVKTVKNGFIQSTVDRNSVMRIQTPQVFDADILKAALVNAKTNGISVTDDCMAVEAMGVSPYVTEGHPDNIKLTVPEDIQAAREILVRRGAQV